ncbi:hypothetical protein SAMD00023353_5700570 [Rosellinia necatrix]|uniref:Uncharacterized protein n=1 Tax=Rosellinia necatrix TaxID=77044 RepID=A0A1W2TTQ9_ROSNE|nr:hypothetical protein SAMD00023353_5700570 [Rosellinia necatrix]
MDSTDTDRRRQMKPGKQRGSSYIHGSNSKQAHNALVVAPESNLGQDPHFSEYDDKHHASPRASRGGSWLGGFSGVQRRVRDKDDQIVSEFERHIESLAGLLQQEKYEAAEQRKRIGELQQQLLESEEKYNILKRRNDKLQDHLDNDEAALGTQLPDEAILTKFRELMGQIKTWANKFCGGASQALIPTAVSSNGYSKELQYKVHQILPVVKSYEDYLNFLDSRKLRRTFVRGWIGYQVATTILRTPPPQKHPVDPNTDIWIPNPGIRRSIQELEQELLSTGHPIILGDFHHWRALTMSLFAQKYPDIPSEALEFMFEGAQDVLDFVNSDVNGEEATHKLFEHVFKPALELSKLLRRQRASWCVRFPQSNIGEDCLFDPNSMRDKNEDEDEARANNVYTHVWVDMVISPGLFKRGTIDGDRYDVEIVVEKAEVSCANYCE